MVWEDNFHPMGALGESSDICAGGDSLAIFKVTLTLFKKTQNEEMSRESEMLLTWVKAFFSLYASRLPLLFKEL